MVEWGPREDQLWLIVLSLRVHDVVTRQRDVYMCIVRR